jgi:hypothetical protein
MKSAIPGRIDDSPLALTPEDHSESERYDQLLERQKYRGFAIDHGYLLRVCMTRNLELP